MAYLYHPNDPTLVEQMMHYEEFQVERSDLGQVIPYVIYMYDLASEMQKLHPDLWSRKKECALKAGWKYKRSNRFAEEVEAILMGEDDQVNTMIIWYVKRFFMTDYMVYVSYQEMLSREIFNSLRGTKSSEIKTIRENIDKIGEKLNDLERRIFGGDETEALRKALYRTMEAEKLRLRPEHIAKAIAKKELKFTVEPFVFKDEGDA